MPTFVKRIQEIIPGPRVVGFSTSMVKDFLVLQTALMYLLLTLDVKLKVKQGKSFRDT